MRGFNSTLRQGSVTHHEYIQVGKGRDVGFNQIATFEGKVAGGNGEQVRSRDIYRLGQRFDFFRMLSLYYTTVGYYFSSLLMVITLYMLLYGNLIMALSGTRVPHVLNDIDMAPEWFLMIVLLPAIYMLLVPYLEQGLEKAVESFLAMFFSLGSIFSAFSLGTRIHWFGRTVIHGGASYQATGRGFVLDHIKFLENYRRYSRSHFVKGMEVLFLVVVYIVYGFHSVRAFYNNLLLLGGSILSFSWIVAPFLFDSSAFDLNKNLEDWQEWNNWLNRKKDEVDQSKPIKDKVKESWEIWWDTELDHIRTPVGRVTETILSLRFFIFPLVVVYKLDVQGLTKSLWNCVLPWICVVVILLVYEVKCKKKPVTQIFSTNRVATIVALPIAYYYLASGDMLAFIIAIITTYWGFISFFSNNGLATIVALAIAYYCSALGGMLAFFIAIVTIVWAFLSICVAWKPTLEIIFPLKYLAWICDIVMRALMFIISVYDDMGMLLLFLLGYVSNACEEFHLWTPVKYLAWICDTGMGALMFKIANMFSQRSIRQYLVRNLFDQNISELLHNSSAAHHANSFTPMPQQGFVLWSGNNLQQAGPSHAPVRSRVISAGVVSKRAPHTIENIPFYNVDPNKVVRIPENYVDFENFLTNPITISLDCHIKGFRCEPKFWKHLLCMGDSDGWLSDDHINAWMELQIRKRRKDDMWTIAKSTVASYSPENEIFLLETDSESQGTLSGRTRPYPSWAQVDKVFMPIHANGNHWVTAVVDLADSTFKVFDSSHNDNRGEILSEQVNAWITVLKKYLQLRQPYFKYSYNEFINGSRIPQQTNGKDCGVITCWLIQQLHSNGSLQPTNLDHSQFFEEFRYTMARDFYHTRCENTQDCGYD